MEWRLAFGDKAPSRFKIQQSTGDAQEIDFEPMRRGCNLDFV